VWCVSRVSVLCVVRCVCVCVSYVLCDVCELCVVRCVLCVVHCV